jgi:hypothetical protein
MIDKIQKDNHFVSEIKQILTVARQKAYLSVNLAMVDAYWLTGKRIVEEEQQGKERAAYGEEILKTLSEELTKEFGKGFGTRNLWDFRKFYLTFPETEIMHTLCAHLGWSHIRLVMRVESRDAQKYYLQEAAENHWSVKTHKITHQDIGQLDMYVRMYDDLKRGKDDNPTIGILLCTETDKTIARYSILNENRQLFTSKYLLYLPTEEELVAEIERQKMILNLQK